MASIYQGFDVRKYEDKLYRAIHRYGLPPKARRQWRKELNYRVRDFLYYVQPVAALYWQIYLYNALIANDVVDRPDIWAMTILDWRWHFGERHWQFAPGKIEYQVRRALKGLNYVVMIEFEVFGNRRHIEEFSSDGVVQKLDYGRVIAPHIQGLIWGGRPSRLQRAKFLGGDFNAPGVMLKPLTNFAGAVRYMVKPPYMGQLIQVRPDGGRRRYPWPEMPLVLHHRLFCNLFEYGYPDLTFAGGEGRAVLAKAKRLWSERVPANLQRYAYPQQPFHRIPLVSEPM